MAFFPTITIGSNSYAGLELGKYQLSTSSMDEPTILEIAVPKIVSDGRSYVSVAMSRQINGLSSGSPDLKAQCRKSYTWDPGFTPTDLRALETELNSWMTLAVLTQLMRAER